MAIPATNNMIKPGGVSVIAFVFPWVLNIIFVLKYKINWLNKKFCRAVIIYMAWGTLQTFKTQHLYDGIFLFLGILTLSYMLIKVYGIRMFYLYEQIVTKLSIVAIIAWIFQVAIPGVFSSFMKKVNLVSFPDAKEKISSIIIFTLQTHTQGTNDGYAILSRNAGFSWEPGRYAVMLILAIYFNLVFKKFEIKNNKNLIILFLALLTTQSTTGYIALFFLMFFYLINTNNKFKDLLFIAIVSIAFFGFTYLSFMKKKINKVADYDIESIISSSKYREDLDGDVIVPQRFNSIYFSWLNFLSDPILGYGIDRENSYVSKEISPKISPTGGVVRLLGQFGLLISFLVYWQLHKTSCFLSQSFQYRGRHFFLILFIIISTSYMLWNVIFFMSLWLFHFFYSDKHKSKSIGGVTI